MIVDLFASYLGSLVEFWSNVVTIRVPHVLLLLLLLWWLFGKGKRRRFGMWHCCGSRPCRCTCGRCCCRDSGEDVEEADVQEVEVEEIEVEEVP